MHRFAYVRPWHGVVVAIAVVVIIALFSLALGTHGIIPKHAVAAR